MELFKKKLHSRESVIQTSLTLVRAPVQLTVYFVGSSYILKNEMSCKEEKNVRVR